MKFSLQVIFVVLSLKKLAALNFRVFGNYPLLYSFCSFDLLHVIFASGFVKFVKMNACENFMFYSTVDFKT